MNTTTYSPVSVAAKAVAAVSCAVITFAIFSGVASLAQPGKTQAEDLALASGVASAQATPAAAVSRVALARGSSTVR